MKRRPYAQIYRFAEWGVRRSIDVTGPCIQVDLGRLGITLPCGGPSP